MCVPLACVQLLYLCLCFRPLAFQAFVPPCVATVRMNIPHTPVPVNCFLHFFWIFLRFFAENSLACKDCSGGHGNGRGFCFAGREKVMGFLLLRGKPSFFLHKTCHYLARLAICSRRFPGQARDDAVQSPSMDAVKVPALLCAHSPFDWLRERMGLG